MLVLAGVVTASAQEYQYIGVQGSWWNVNFAGEGFAIEEYGDGFMIAYWYTYDEDGQQMWLLGTGEREGNTVVLDMVRTSGGSMADMGNPENVTEEPWGTVTLEIEDCSHINMSFESLSGLSGAYSLLRLLRAPLAAGSCNAIEVEAPEPPETDPPVEDPPPEPPEAPPVTLRLQKRVGVSDWQDVDIPFTGLAVIHKSYSGNPPRISLFNFRLIAEGGEVTFGNVTASEPTGISEPSVEGISPGMSFPEGSIINFSLESNTTGGVRVYPFYNVWVEGYGEIVNLTVRLSTQSH